jgi:O-acetyl-ADP-ribose deacetylase (regulator of RNase III)
MTSGRNLYMIECSRGNATTAARSAARTSVHKGKINVSVRVASSDLRLVQGDITEQDTHAIVNAANSTLMGGGGVDGAIHRAGGSEILDECRRIRSTSHPDGLPTGEAVVTTGGLLRARRVIHTVGPIWRGGSNNEAKLLADAYRNSLRIAAEEGLRTIAFPSISTGAYGYPTERAAEVALRTVIEEIRARSAAFDEVRFVLFSPADLQIYNDTLHRLLRETGG